MSTEHPDTFRFIVRTGDPDGNGVITDMGGWDLERYRRNPVVFLNHLWHLPPVGKARSVALENGRMVASIQFAPTPLGRELALLNADLYMRAASVQFRPIEWEVRRHPDHGYPIGIHSHRQELLEISVVGVPADPNALRAALQSDSDLETHLLASEAVDYALEGVPGGPLWTWQHQQPALSALRVMQGINAALRGGA